MLRNKFKNELLEAMKEKDTTRVSTLRLILAAIKDRDLESKRKGNGDHITDSNILGSIFSSLATLINAPKSLGKQCPP